jgi:hypothetical protein
MSLRVILTAALSSLALTTAAIAACDTQEPGRFVANGDEVYDSKTNLTWQRCSVGQRWEGDTCAGALRALTWDEARKAAQANWRLPTREELEGLVEQPCGLPASAKAVFPAFDPYHPSYWSASAPDAGLAFEVGFDNGAIFNGFRTAPNAVRLVRTGK